MVSLTPRSAQPDTLNAAILGSDLLLAALPAEPVQIIHAAQALGFELVVPASWGDELIAAAALDELSSRPPGTAILCSCPNARRRILAPGNELAPFLINTVSPPVAAARYLRAVHGGTPLDITYLGSCPGAQDDSINARLSPAEFLSQCSQRGISLVDQPRVFESTIPIDRRRHFSMPGGLPTQESVASAQAGTDIVSPDSSSISFDITQSIIAGKVLLLDLAPAVGCPCSGFVADSEWSNGRAVLLAHEPPRSPTAIVDARVDVDLELPGQGPTQPAFEENVPLSVVVGADLSVSGLAAQPEPNSAPRQSLHMEAIAAIEQSELPIATDIPDDAGNLVDAAREIESLWSDFPHPAVAPRESGEERDDHPDSPLTAERESATPVRARPAQTPAGSLSRAYLMVRKLRASAEQVEPTDAVSGTPDSDAPDKAQQPEAAASQNSRGTVDTVLDILTRAIRDVVEP
jgi:hypothetical protein